MTKNEFLKKLRVHFKELSTEEIEERLLFYCEMIDDRIEEGLTEDQAVAEIGPIEAISVQSPAETAEEKSFFKKLKLTPLTIILLILGSPIWVSLLCAAVSVVISVYAAIWSVIIALWAVWGSLIAVAFAGIFSTVILFIKGHPLSAIAVIGTALFSAGLSIFAFFGLNYITKSTVLLTKKFFLWVKSLFVGKEEE